jgi:hypothetical protein
MYDFLGDNIIDIATKKHSCCALQKCIEVANDKQRLQIYNKIADNAFLLIGDPFGNYVIQFVVTFENYEINAKIAQVFMTNIGYLSKQKFSSNVIEKCFDYCDDDTKQSIIKELCNPKLIPELLLDMYGNYGKILHLNILI